MFNNEYEIGDEVTIFLENGLASRKGIIKSIENTYGYYMVSVCGDGLYRVHSSNIKLMRTRSSSIPEDIAIFLLELRLGAYTDAEISQKSKALINKYNIRLSELVKDYD